MPPSSGPAPAPGWVFGDELEPDVVKAWLCLDYGDDLARVRPVLQMWYDQAVALLSGLVQPAGAAKPRLRRSGCLEDVEGVGRQIRPRTWADGIADDYLQVSWSWYDTAAAAPVSDLDLYVFRFLDRRHVMLSATASMGGRPGQLPRVLPQQLELLCSVADAADPTYGEVVVNAASLAPDTMLDAALRRGRDVSARESRAFLRGYEWVTVCPTQLVARLGGVDGLRASGAFAEVTPLGAGGVVLRATNDPARYGPDQARGVFAALAAVLPPGRPRPLPGYDMSRLVLADASEQATLIAPPATGTAPSHAEPEDAAVQQFVIEAATKGWVVEAANGSMAFTAEGQRRFDELVERARGDGPAM